MRKKQSRYLKNALCDNIIKYTITLSEPYNIVNLYSPKSVYWNLKKKPQKQMKWSKLTLLDLGRRSLDQVSTPSYLSLKNLYNLNKSRACKATRGQAIRWNWYLNIFNHRIIKKYLYNKRWCHDSTLCEIKHIYQEELIHDHTMRKNGQNKKKNPKI